MTAKRAKSLCRIMNGASRRRRRSQRRRDRPHQHPPGDASGHGARDSRAATAPTFALVDGNDAPALPCPCDTLVGGDARSVSIAAASIIAKVTRDRMMQALHENIPAMAGSPTRATARKSTSKRWAPRPCRHHRRSFAPVHNILYGGRILKTQSNALIPKTLDLWTPTNHCAAHCG
jgi:hypothetical protein